MSNLDALLAAEFPVERNLLYLNHAAVAPLPVRAGAAIRAFADQCVAFGSRHYGEWLETEARLRAQLAELIHAPGAGDIALLKNTSEGLSVVAHGFPWQAGDNVVISDEEFPSNRIVWQSLAGRGVEVREVALRGAPSPEQALIERADRRTRLLSISSVEYASGLRLDLAQLGRACRERGIAFCVDAIQGVGAIRHDVQTMCIDFLVADAHKWLLGPEGIALFYCAPEWRERLSLHQYGWHMTEEHLNFDAREWKPAHSARRFECGSQNMLGIHAFAASLSLLREIGTQEVERRILRCAEHLFAEIARRPHLECLTDTTPGRYAGIVTFRHTRVATDVLYARLVAHGVVCAQRGGGIRFSPHCYHRLDTLDRALALTDD